MSLLRTPLYDEHVALGAKIVDFAGWEMPVQYAGVIAEHKGVRAAAGLFDVSHMGELMIEGPDAEALVNAVITNDITRIEDGQAQYTVMCTQDGGIVDDLIVYRLAPDRFLAIINASNIAKDFEHFSGQVGDFDATVDNISNERALIALQGPHAPRILAAASPDPAEAVDVGRFRFAAAQVAGVAATVARTGYTGEDGYELMLPWDKAPEVWRALLEAGKPHGLVPAGLGARDTLRLEMAYPLYGNDIDATTNPLEAGLGWVVKLGKERFVGREALARVKADGPSRTRVGIEMVERGIPRHGYRLLSEDGNEIGHVTSGTQSPSLDKPIALGYVPTPLAAPGTRIAVEIRGKARKAVVVETPFLKRVT